MATFLSEDLNETAAERPDANRPPEPVLGIQPHDPRPLDWRHAVEAATARLDESWVHPDSTGQMVALGLADELAATLCAYGMVAAEIDHMHARADDPTSIPPKSPE
jgi:hypothetical protein